MKFKEIEKARKELKKDFKEEMKELDKLEKEWTKDVKPYSDDKGKSLCCGGHITKKNKCQMCKKDLGVFEE